MLYTKMKEKHITLYRGENGEVMPQSWAKRLPGVIKGYLGCCWNSTFYVCFTW